MTAIAGGNGSHYGYFDAYGGGESWQVCLMWPRTS